MEAESVRKNRRRRDDSKGTRTSKWRSSRSDQQVLAEKQQEEAAITLLKCPLQEFPKDAEMQTESVVVTDSCLQTDDVLVSELDLLKIYVAVFIGVQVFLPYHSFLFSPHRRAAVLWKGFSCKIVLARDGSISVLKTVPNWEAVILAFRCCIAQHVILIAMWYKVLSSLLPLWWLSFLKTLVHILSSAHFHILNIRVRTYSVR